MDGQVVFSTAPGFTALPSDDKRTRFETFGHLLNAEERTLFDKMTAQGRRSRTPCRSNWKSEHRLAKPATNLCKVRWRLLVGR